MFTVIVEMKYGSHLYGLETPTSDLDYKGIFMPTAKDILLGRIPKNVDRGYKVSEGAKNTNGDVDRDFYSLHYFLDLACAGETVAIDMLHAPKECIVVQSNVWRFLQSERHRFYTKKLKSYLGYARNQVKKYSVKGERLAAALEVYDKFKNCGNNDIKLGEIRSFLPLGEFLEFCRDENNPNVTYYSVCGRKFGMTVTVEYFLDCVKKIIDSYGHRAKEAMDNGALDWKAITHALRACYELEELYSEGTITFPLKNREFLLGVKKGEFDFINTIYPLLEGLIIRVEELAGKSNLPETVDRTYWDEYLFGLAEDVVCSNRTIRSNG